MITRGYVTSVGARTAVGLNASQTGFLLRAGSAAMATAPLLDEGGQPITFCHQPTLDPHLVGAARAARLGAPAMEEAMAPLRKLTSGKGQGLKMKFVLCIDEIYARSAGHGQAHPAAELVSYLHTTARELVPGIPIELCAQGAAGAAMVLPKALDALASGEVDAVLLGGVHTDYDPAVIRVLESQGRLYSPDNLDALIPGEAAAFVVLMRGEVARRAELELLCAVHAIGSGFEEATPDNDVSAYAAKGLTQAMKIATKELVDEGRTVGWSLTDLTFEIRKLYEWQAMFTRTRKVWGDPFHMESPAQRLGHLGAAALPLQLVLAAEGYLRGYAPSDLAIAFAGSDRGERGVVVVGRP